MKSTFKLLAFYGPLPGLVLSMALSIPQSANNIFQSTGLQNESLIPYLLAQKNDSSLTSAGDINCNQALYGNPPIESCRDAVAQIPQDPRTLIVDQKRSYGPRDQDTAFNFDVGLPRRWISGQLFYTSSTSW